MSASSSSPSSDVSSTHDPRNSAEKGRSFNPATNNRRHSGLEESCSFTSEESTSSSACSDFGGNGGEGEVKSLTYQVSPTPQSKHCWSKPGSGSFQVRGKNYLQDGRKVSSDGCLLSVRGCDLFLSDSSEGTENIGRNPSILGGNLRKVPSFVINFRFPWGVLTFSYEMAAKFLPFLHYKYEGQGEEDEATQPSTAGMSPAELSMVRFLLGSDEEKSSSLKLIPRVIEGPWIVRNLVTGTPVIIGNKVPMKFFYEPADGVNGLAEYLEVDLDIGHSIKPRAKKIVSVLRRYMDSVSFDLGWVVQGDTPLELPEQLLASTRVHRLDPENAPNLRIPE